MILKYIESWKAITLALEMFCFGGYLFCDKSRVHTSGLLYVLMIVFGMVLLVAF